MSRLIDEPFANGFCDKCQWNKGQFCKAYVFLGRLADCFFVSCCEKYKAGEHHE